MSKKQSKKKAGSVAKLNMRATLIMFALIPLVVSSVTIGIISVMESSSEITNDTQNSMIQVIENVGDSFDTVASKNGDQLKAFSAAPIIKSALANQGNASIQAEAQKYTEAYFDSLDGFEGIYLANWDSQVLAHSASSAVGMVLREGEKLVSLQNSLLTTEGVYNNGVITSPSSGQIIMSMYYPIIINDQPMGFVGCGSYVSSVASEISDVSNMGIKSAYVYFVDKAGTMLYHPDESKIGQPVENDAVKGLVAELEAGRHPDPGVVEYTYHGKAKYASYYIGEGDRYIAILTADADDVLSSVARIRTIIIVICVACIILFAIIAMLVERVISVPLVKISQSLVKLSTGDVTVDCDAKSHIKETVSIIDAFAALKEALSNSMRSVKNSASVLNNAIISVDDMTGNNVESVSQINNAINEVAETSQSVAQSATSMAERAAELGENIEALSDNVSALSEASQTIRNANNEATECMDSVYAGANESVEAMTNITSQIAETNSAISEIETAVQAIESIAAQTNLLSLNASIEAARAGEAGKGFAVVADEIRALADSSAESAKEIKKIIENVIVLSGGTVEMSNRVFEVINKEQADIEQAQDKFNILSESVEASITGIDTIRSMTGTLDRIKNELTQSTSDLGAISEELGASAQEVAASCQTVTEACSDTQNSTTEMRNINEDMSAAIDFFKL